METQKDIQKINKEALEKVCLAQPILNKLIVNPSLACFHDSVLSKIGESRWSGHFVRDTLYDIMNMYSAKNPNDIPEQVQEFVKGANNFLYGGKN
ncbi:MAG: hypothetical protein AABY32_05835 [Nanoarchaeota archaeon]